MLGDRGSDRDVERRRSRGSELERDRRDEAEREREDRDTSNGDAPPTELAMLASETSRARVAGHPAPSVT